MIPEDFKVIEGTRGKKLVVASRSAVAGTSLRDIERAAKRLPDGAFKEQKLQDLAALRDAQAAVRKVRKAIRSKAR
jgi:hypothetical protein